MMTIVVDGLQITIHYVSVDVTKSRMKKCLRKTAGYLKPETLPKSYRSFVCTHHEIELHGSKFSVFRMAQRMRTHRSGYSSSNGRKCSDVTAVSYMGTTAHLIGTEEIGPDHMLVLFGYENLMTA
jgi:hypothetical protein